MAVDLRTTQEYLNAKLGTVGLTKQQCIARLAGVSENSATSDIAWNAYAATLATPRTAQGAANMKVGKPSISAIDQSQIGTTGALGFGNAGIRQKNAQSFIPTYGHLKSIDVRKRTSTGTYIGDVTISLQGDANGIPNGGVIATRTILNATWEGFADRTVVTLTADVNLSVGATYWIVATSSTQDAANFPGMDGAGGELYTRGTDKIFDGATWTEIAGTDWYFITNVQIDDMYTIQEAARRL